MLEKLIDKIYWTGFIYFLQSLDIFFSSQDGAKGNELASWLK